MKRLICLLAVAALTSAPVAHYLFAAPPAGNKVALCHVPEEGDDDFDEGPHVIVVSTRAQESHLDHGDCVIAQEDLDAVEGARAGWSCDPTNEPSDDGEADAYCDNPSLAPPADDEDDDSTDE